MAIRFSVGARDPGSRARRGRLETSRGTVETPVFMPVGTRATVTGMTPDDLQTLGAPIILANTYHLLLRPGPELFRRVGGIHSFMRWPGPVLTDSGGYQIFSLPDDRTISEEGARFKSYVDCRFHLLSPERSIEMQTAIGSDIMMVLDECIDSTADEATTRAAMERTHRWALRSLTARTANDRDTRRRCSPSCRAAWCRRCGASRRRSCRSIRSTASPSAGWPSATAARSATR